MKRIIICILCMFGIITGCSKNEQSHTVVFEKNIEVDYKKDENTAQYVKRVDSFMIDGSMIEENKIHVSNFTVECPSLKTEKLGNITLVYKIGEEEYPLTITVIDRTKPSIKAESNLEFEVGEMKNINEYFSISDNFDKKENLSIKVQGLDLVNKDKVGEWDITITVTDSSDNKSTKKVHIKIRDTKKEEEEKRKKELEEQKRKEQQVQQSQSQNSSQSGQVAQPIPQQPPRPAYSSKDFLFSQGYDMTTAPNACQQELLASGMAGACTPLQDSEGIYYGMRLTFY